MVLSTCTSWEWEWFDPMAESNVALTDHPNGPCHLVVAVKLMDNDGHMEIIWKSYASTCAYMNLYVFICLYLFRSSAPVFQTAEGCTMMCCSLINDDLLMC